MSNVRSFGIQQLSTFIEDNLEKDGKEVARVFMDNDISGDIFVDLTEKEVDELLADFKFGPKKRVKKLINSCLAEVRPISQGIMSVTFLPSYIVV